MTGCAFSASRFCRAGHGPAVMGILNVTPDSFSDGGRFAAHGAAIEAGRAMWADGADIVDIGGESTRPGAAPVSADEEGARILPVIKALSAEGIFVSIDTRHAAVMAASLAAGAQMINDVSALADPPSAAIIAAHGCPVVLMHMRGTPQTMAGLTAYGDVVAEVKAEILARIEGALAAGILAKNIVIDPGIGFAKTPEQSLSLLQNLQEFAGLGHELLLGVSRKSVIGALSGEADPMRRDAGSIAAGLLGAAKGASILRVHDVAGHVQALRVWRRVAGFDRV